MKWHTSPTIRPAARSGSNTQLSPGSGPALARYETTNGRADPAAISLTGCMSGANRRLKPVMQSGPPWLEASAIARHCS